MLSGSGPEQIELLSQGIGHADDNCPYLFFAGRCEEALNFYCSALGAEIGMMMRFNENPDPTPPEMLQAGFENKIMHSDFTVKGVSLMASYGCDDQEGAKHDGYRLALAVPTEVEARAAFDALARIIHSVERFGGWVERLLVGAEVPPPQGLT